MVSEWELVVIVAEALRAAQSDPDPTVSSSATRAMKILTLNNAEVTQSVRDLSTGTQQEKLDAITDIFQFLQSQNVTIGR